MTFLDQCKQIMERATPGPWKFTAGLYTDARLWIESLDCALFIKAGDKKLYGKMAENAEFIAFSRTAMPELVRLLEDLVVETKMLLNIANTIKKGLDEGINTVPSSYPHGNLKYQIPRVEKILEQFESPLQEKPIERGE